MEGLTISLLSLSAATLIVYLIFACRKGGIPPSVSDTYYRIKHPALFFVAMAAISLPLLPVGLEIEAMGSQFFMFAAVFGMLLVGCAPNFKGADRALHTTGAALSLLCSQAWMAINFPLLLLVWLACGMYLFISWRERRLKATKPLFWVEITALLTVYITMIKLI